MYPSSNFGGLKAPELAAGAGEVCAGEVVDPLLDPLDPHAATERANGTMRDTLRMVGVLSDFAPQKVVGGSGEKDHEAV
jgi:hypothetical protein